MLCIAVYGICHVKDGLDLTDIVPRNTNEFRFLSQRAKYFGFFNMYAVTQGNFEYPTNQKLLHDYHDAFTRIERIIKNDDGGLPDFWLSMFRDWLLGKFVFLIFPILIFNLIRKKKYLKINFVTNINDLQR